MSDKRKNQKNNRLAVVGTATHLAPATRGGDCLAAADTASLKSDIFVFFLLLAFGVYQSILYWGHQPVPHFDFECFGIIGRQILSFHVPTDYKRVPLVGILQIFLGHITGGASPDLIGGWLLNSISHTLTVVFLWLAARKIIGRNAIWFAIIAIINPFGLQLLTEAIAETPMLFFIWITFYLIFIRSKWAYLFASLATMVRYECAALIVGAFVLDMIEGNKKQRIMAFIYASLASVPLAIWMLGTILHSETTGGTHYLNIFSKNYSKYFAEGVENRIGFKLNADILWQTGFYSLFQPSPMADSSFISTIFILNKILVVLSFCFGSIYGLFKKQWKILVLLIFLVPYFVAHAKYPYPIHRYYATVFAIVMLICVYGFLSFWNIIKDKLPKPAVILSQLILLMIAIFWILILFGFLPQLAPMSKASISLPYIAILVAALAFAAQIYLNRKKLFTDIVILSLLILMIVSNQFVVANVVGNGERDIEFKYLADWYIKNAAKGEKLVCTVPSILQIIEPKYKDCFIHTQSFDANNPNDFVMECLKKNITYVAWDSREGLMPTDYYYKSWKMSNIAPLAAGRDIGPYQFITQFRVNQRRYVNLYRLRPLSQLSK